MRALPTVQLRNGISIYFQTRSFHNFQWNHKIQLDPKFKNVTSDVYVSIKHTTQHTPSIFRNEMKNLSQTREQNEMAKKKLQKFLGTTIEPKCIRYKSIKQWDKNRRRKRSSRKWKKNAQTIYWPRVRPRSKQTIR